MSFLSQIFNQNASRHFAVACIVLLVCCYQMAHATSAGGKQKYSQEQKLSPRRTQHETERKKDNSIFSTLSRSFISQGPPDFNYAKPAPDYLKNILNAAGVLGLGFLWIKELSASIGTPILVPVLMPPLILLGIALLLIPDTQRLGEILEGSMNR